MSDKRLQDYAIELAAEALRGYEFIDVAEQLENLTDEECEQVHDLITGGVKAYIPESPRIIRTPEELEALARDDAAAIVLAGEAGVARTARALCELRQLVYAWGLPAVVVATGKQVRAAREAMELDNGF